MDITTLSIVLIGFFLTNYSIITIEKDFNRRMDILNRDLEKIERLAMALLEQQSTTQHLLEDHLKSSKFLDRYDDEP